MRAKRFKCSKIDNHCFKVESPWLCAILCEECTLEITDDYKRILFDFPGGEYEMVAQ